MTFYLWHKNHYSFLFPSQLCVAGNEIVWEKICIYMIDTLCVARQTSQSNATAIWRTNSTNNKSRKKLNSSKNDHSIHARFEWKSQTSQWEPRFQKPQPITIQISQIIMSCHWSPLFFFSSFRFVIIMTVIFFCTVDYPFPVSVCRHRNYVTISE